MRQGQSWNTLLISHLKKVVQFSPQRLASVALYTLGENLSSSRPFLHIMNCFAKDKSTYVLTFKTKMIKKQKSDDVKQIFIVSDYNVCGALPFYN